MKTRKVGPYQVNDIGFGCMSLSHGYGSGPDEAYGIELLNRALDIGYNFFDTASLYGAGANEELLGKAIMHRRSEVVLASKCGLFFREGKKIISGRPEDIRRVCEDSLRRLNTDFIDLYYLHRRDFTVPIEESVGEMGRLLDEGKIGAIGLSEMSAETLRKGHKERTIAAIQTEYSLWSRNAEIAVLDACQELDIAFVAFSPLARGFLTGKLTEPARQLEENDIRHKMPRFNAENYPENLRLLNEYFRIAEKLNCTPAQLALAWVRYQRDFIIPIPGTKKRAYLEENIGAAPVEIDEVINSRLNALINQSTVKGRRYNEVQQKEIETERFEPALA